MATSSGFPDPSASPVSAPSETGYGVSSTSGIDAGAGSATDRATGNTAGNTAGNITSDTASGTTAGNGTQRNANELFARVVQGAHDTVDRLADTAAPHVQRLSQGVDTASDTLQQRADQVRDVSDEWAETLRTTVRENPLASLAAAVAVGVIIARLTS